MRRARLITKPFDIIQKGWRIGLNRIFRSGRCEESIRLPDICCVQKGSIFRFIQAGRWRKRICFCIRLTMVCLRLLSLFPSIAGFSVCYVYAPEGTSMWKKLISRRFCEKIMPLFGVSTIGELKERISKCTLDRNYRYSSGFAYSVPLILSYVELDNVAVYS